MAQPTFGINPNLPSDCLPAVTEGKIFAQVAAIDDQGIKEANSTHILYIDSDIGFAPEQVFAMLDFDKDFVAGA